MSLLDTASLILTPNGYKADKLYSVKPTNGDGDMVVSRGTTATRVNSAGLIESVAINVPRLDYTGGGCPSILVEPLRTNLVFPSATLTTQTRTVTAVAHTLSFYGTGTIVLSGVHIATLTGTGANNRVTLTFTPTAGSLILTVAGTVTNAQLEAGSNATSYIPTVASTVTRNADVISKTGISSLIGQTEGTLFVEINITTFNNGVFFSINDGTSGNRIQMYKFTDNKIYCDRISATQSVTTSINSSALSVGTYKVAFAYQSGNSYLYINGAQVGATSAATFTFGSIGKVNIGSRFDDTSTFNDRIKSAILFPTRLSPGQLQTLTA